MFVAAHGAGNTVGKVDCGVRGSHESERHQAGTLWEIAILGLQMIRYERASGHWISTAKVLLHQRVCGFLLSLFFPRSFLFLVLLGPSPTSISAIVVVTHVVATKKRGNLGVIVLD